MSFIRGYKGFMITVNGKFRCEGLNYAIGKTTTINNSLDICKSGIHYYEAFKDVLYHYPNKPGIRYGLVHDVGTRRVNSKRNSVTDALKLCKMLDGMVESKQNIYVFNEGMLTFVLSKSGTREWFNDGKLHRDDGPAIECADGTKMWFVDGKCHRDDGPAIERVDGTKMWYIDGQCHRVDGPVIERVDGTKKWFFNGKFHKVDGSRVWLRND